jgi:hypothetical protein
MVHERHRLPFSLEPGDDIPGVHSQLDDFEGDVSADRLFLFRKINHTATALTNLVQKPVPTDSIFGLLKM